MATIEDFESRIREIAKYYIELPEHAKNGSDMSHALMAKESSEDILSIVEKYKMNPKTHT